MRALLVLALVAGAAPATAQHDHGAPAAPATPATLREGLGDHRHPIATESPEAQRFFDQGLIYYYAFNHEEAVHSFERAAALDPDSPMPHWGVALALGPNINMDVDPERERQAHAAIQRARRLAKGAPPIERAYVEALAGRYSDAPQPDLKALAEAYKEAMGDLVRRYPDDLDAATLYAESAMNLRPWRLWDANGFPAPGTEELVGVLESVLRRDPRHPGANHFYVHAVEASRNPERALPSAARLENLVPAAGHLVHMPSHIYMRTGDYAAAARSNEQAIAADRAYMADQPGARTMYAVMYAPHNIHFAAAAYAMAGRQSDAKRAADDVVAAVGADPTALPPEAVAMLDAFVATPLYVAVRFRRWDDLTSIRQPDARLPVSRALWHFARGSAAAAGGRRADARAERDALAAAQAQLAPDVVPGALFGLNQAVTIVDVALAVLDARLAEAEDGPGAAVPLWERAVVLEDRVAYNEPADWPLPTREGLGAALLRARRPAEAEVVFRAELARNPRSGRALFGLRESLKAAKRTGDAEWVAREFERAWRDADTPLRLADL
jgi:tetratricopeptide (TPR) repeat protein